MGRAIKLIGLDCGSTTSCLVVANGQLTTGALGRVDITNLEECFRSELVFTPLAGTRIDVVQLEAHVDAWLEAAKVKPTEIFGGGALITGLAAARENSAVVARMLSSRLADAVVAVADAPRMESWLAFLGNCHDLSLTHPQTPILNLDLGGGTTNLALGQNGQVVATGALHVGARHFRFEPGGYRLLERSPLGARLLESLSIRRALGEKLAAGEVAAIVNFYVAQLVATIEGRPPVDAIAAKHVQVSLELPPIDTSQLAITLSGGVGELVYRGLQNPAEPTPAEFGDLGGELARGIANCTAIANRLSLVPAGLGRATVLGMMRHSTEVSGSTLYLPHPNRLPLANVPVLGRVDSRTSAGQLASLLTLATAQPAAALQVDLEPQDLAALRSVGELLANELSERPLRREFTLVLLTAANLGKTLGNYVTRWGTLNVELIVIDEVPWRDAQFVRLGQPRETVVPLWLYAVR